MGLNLPERATKRAERLAEIPALMAAAAADDVDAQVALAWEYARGEVVELNVAAAWRWFERAAASGREDAIGQYARFLQLRGVPEGVRRLRKLAALGNWQAQFCLAQQYQVQPGRLNQLRAVVWFDRSAKCGNLMGGPFRFAQLSRVAPSRRKPLLYCMTIFALGGAIRRLLQEEAGFERYARLTYRLKRPAT